MLLILDGLVELKCPIVDTFNGIYVAIGDCSIHPVPV